MVICGSGQERPRIRRISSSSPTSNTYIYIIYIFATKNNFKSSISKTTKTYTKLKGISLDLNSNLFQDYLNKQSRCEYDRVRIQTKSYQISKKFSIKSARIKKSKYINWQAPSLAREIAAA